MKQTVESLEATETSSKKKGKGIRKTQGGGSFFTVRVGGGRGVEVASEKLVIVARSGDHLFGLLRGESLMVSQLEPLELLEDGRLRVRRLRGRLSLVDDFVGGLHDVVLSATEIDALIGRDGHGAFELSAYRLRLPGALLLGSHRIWNVNLIC